MIKTAKSILALLLVLMTSFSSLAQEENVKQEKPNGHKVKEEVAQMYSLVEFTDFSSLSPAQKKHFELYRRQKQMRLAICVFFSLDSFSNVFCAFSAASTANGLNCFAKSAIGV